MPLSHRQSAETARRFSRAMTVANIRGRKDSDYVEVIFLESARFYRLSTANSGFERIMEHLRDALAERRVLHVRLASPDSDVIEEIEIPG